MITLQPMNIQSAAADLLWSRVLKTYPDLRIALSEGGTGWIPYFLDRVDRTYEMHRAWTQQDFGGRLPSEVFREHFLTCFITTRSGCSCGRRSASTTCAGRPTTPQRLDVAHRPRGWPRVRRARVPDDIRKMTHENAMRWYSFDPFIRAEGRGDGRRAGARAAGHDVSIMSRSTQVRTADEKLEGFACAGRRAVARRRR